MSKPFTYGSACSGIEAATVAFDPLGWRPAFFAEIEPFCCKLLAHYYPEVPNHGDFQTIERSDPIDLLIGGTPCQDFSVAGARAGLDGARGQLSVEFFRLAYRIGAPRLLWENVPGVFTLDAGRVFGFLLAQAAGYPDGFLFEPPEGGWRDAGVVEPANAQSFGLAWRVLDAQFWGVAQRRNRVFVVGYLGNWQRAAAVLFERSGMRGDSPPRREKRESATANSIAGTVSSKWAKGAGGPAGDEAYNLIANPLASRTGGFRQDLDNDTYVVPEVVNNTGHGYWNESPGELAEPVRGDGRSGGSREATVVAFKASHYTRDKDGAPSEIAPPLSADADKGDQDTLIFESRYARNGRGAPADICPPLKAENGQTGKGDGAPLVAFSFKDDGQGSGDDLSPTMRAINHDESHANGGSHLAVAFSCKDDGQGCAEDHTPTMRGNSNGGSHLAATVGAAVRRLTPLECERLQGFPDNYTAIPGAADSPRYRALGNSMAVPVIRWLGERMRMVDEIP